MDTVRQLPLKIQLDTSASFANFFAGENQLLLDYLQNFFDNSEDWFVYLWGVAASGRTHLLQASCHLAESLQQPTAYIPLAEHKNFSPAILDNLENFSLVILDDLSLIVGDRAWEEALFHLYNRVHTAQHKLIVSADQAPQSLAIRLADLQSRIAVATIFKLKSLTDAEKLSGLQLRAMQRGLTLPLDVARFMLHHCRRDLSSLFTSFEKLDQASLAAKRKLTIPFVKEVLKLG